MNYGSRDEILRGMTRMIEDVKTELSQRMRLMRTEN